MNRTRPLCAAHPGLRPCCQTRQLGPHSVSCGASWGQRQAMGYHEQALRHEHELTHPRPRTFCWYCGHQLAENPLFTATHWETGDTIGFCTKPHYDLYQELISLWA